MMRVKSVLIVCVLFLTSLLQAAQKDLSTTEHYPVSQHMVMVIEAADLDLQVRSADVDQIEVATELHIGNVRESSAERWIENHTPAVEFQEGKLRIVVEPSKSGFLRLGFLTAKARLGIIAPSQVNPAVSTTSGSLKVRGDFPDADPLRLRTATGDVEMMGAAASLDLRSVSGDANIEVVRPLENFFARTSSGDVRVVGGSRETHVETASGKIWLENLSGSVIASTSTGKITLRWDRLDPEHTIRVRASSAKVYLTLPEGVHPGGTLTTTTGTIRSDFPGEVSEDGGTLRLQGDGPVLDVETASGEILLTSGDSQ